MEGDPDLKRFVTVIFMLDEVVSAAEREIAEMEHFGTTPCPKLASFQLQLRIHSMDFTDRIKDFEEKEKNLNRIYGDPIEREYQLYYEEADQRFKNALQLWKNIGAGLIDGRYAYSSYMSPDFIDFSDWGED